MTITAWAFDNDAQNVAPSAITASQLTLPLQSSAAFATLTSTGFQAVVRIDDTGYGATPGKYEFVLVTGNTTATNTLTISERGYAGTTATSFMPGATVTEIITGEVLNGAFARIDEAPTFPLPVTFSDTISVAGDASFSSTAEFDGATTFSSPVTTSTSFGDFTGSGRYLGVMSSAGKPTSTSVTYVTGDWGFDSLGVKWLCVSGGSPGTWISPGGCNLLHVSSAAATAAGGPGTTMRSVTFTNASASSTILVFGSASAYTSTSGAHSVLWEIDGATKLTQNFYFNVQSSAQHTALPMVSLSATSLTPGSHTLSAVTSTTGIQNDTNDWVTFLVLEMFN